MDRQVRNIVATVVGALAIGLSAQSSAGTDDVTGRATYVNNSGQVVHCVSTQSGRTYCGAPHSRYAINGTPARECVQGSTWGFDDRGVWVSGGCRADFSVVVVNDASGHVSSVNLSQGVVHCASAANGHTYCGGPHMQYTMSGRPKPECVQGSTWGTDERGVWVSGGCTADFDEATGDSTERFTRVNDTGRLLHCVSTNSGRSYCGTAHAHYVITNNRDPACIEGSTWGVDDRGAWVNGTCIADFRLDEQ